MQPAATPARKKSIFDIIEAVGNKVPEPAILFALFATLVVLLSGIGAAAGWSVQPSEPRVVTVEKLDAQGAPVLGEGGIPERIPLLNDQGRPQVELVAKGDPITPRSLLNADGVYWMLSKMLVNFTGLPALGLIFASMLGIGVAEKFGLFGAAMRGLALIAPRKLLTPIIIMVGANSSIASDAGYIILPPLAAALYAAMGRSPIAGLAAAFSGVAGGFCAGFSLNASDAFMAGQATQAAHIIDATRDVVPTANWYFKAASVVVLMAAGWFVTDRLVEPRLLRQTPAGDESQTLTSMSLEAREKKGLAWAGLTMAAVIALFAAMMFIPGWPLYGDVASARPGGRPEPKWSTVIVPMMLFIFMVPGALYGLITGGLRNQRDFVDALYHGVRSIVPVLVIAFFLGQFVEYFKYTQLDRMLAYAGGSVLVTADLPLPLLIAAFVLLVVLGDFAMSGLMSKFAVMAPIFVPMFMMVGISPELMMASYRIGDSVVNVITPLNSYMLIILAVLQKYQKSAGLGSLLSLMLPYSLVYFVTWTGFLLLWYALGLPLGPGGPLHYTPPH